MQTNQKDGVYGVSDKVDSMFGKEFGQLKVLSLGPKTDRGAKQYICVCICGQWTTVRSDSLRSGHTKSCGCIKRGETQKGLMHRGKGASLRDPFVEEIKAQFFRNTPAGGQQYGFVKAVGQRVANKVGGFGYYLTKPASKATKTGKGNPFENLIMADLERLGIVDAQGTRSMKAWKHANGVNFVNRRLGSVQDIAQDHAALNRGETDEYTS